MISYNSLISLLQYSEPLSLFPAQATHKAGTDTESGGIMCHAHSTQAVIGLEARREFRLQKRLRNLDGERQCGVSGVLQ